MSVPEPFPSHPPRASDAELLKRSLKRPKLATWLLGTLCVLSLLNVELFLGAHLIGSAVTALVMTTLCGYSAWRHLLAYHRLIAIWRDGVRADVVLKKYFYFWTYAYRYTIELGDRRAAVILRADSEPDTKLPALVAGDLVAVSDFGWCLKAGRLRTIRR